MEIYDLKELKLRRPGEVLAEIPDSYYSKKFIPLADNLFTALRLSDSWQQYVGERVGGHEELERTIRARVDESMETDKAIKEKKISKKRMQETVCYWGYPPMLPIRMDMARLSTTMIYGPSVDISFAYLDDEDRDLAFIFNIHVEESIMEDLWFISKKKEPEIYNRRHMKLGIRLTDLGKKIKDNIEVARRIKDILIDIRNERNPQWADSAYYIAVFFLVGVSNIALEFSNWNSMGMTWDGVNAVDRYGLPNCTFTYEPLPPILNMMFQLERPMWIERLTGALMNRQLYLTHSEASSIEKMKQRSYDLYDIFMRSYSWQLHQGIVLPSQTLQANPPVYDKTRNEWTKYGFDYPAGPRVHFRDLGLAFEEVMSGVLFDITHKSKIDKVTRDNIVSIGHGLKTKYMRPEED